MDGGSLAPLHSVVTGGHMVAWAPDGTLIAGGHYDDGTEDNPIFAWTAGGRGTERKLQAGHRTVSGVVALPGGDLLVATQDPLLARLTSDGQDVWTQPSPLADFRAQHTTLRVSDDGSVVEFGYAYGGKTPARFDAARLILEKGAKPEPNAAPPRQQGLPIEGWVNACEPTLAGVTLPLHHLETSRSLALHPDSGRFVLGADWSLRAFDARGAPLWHHPVPDAAWAVNVTGDGRLVVSAYGDGTIRWHRMEDGCEILAFMPLENQRDWVAWTPKGFYAASPGAHGVLRWHVNQPGWQPALAYRVADISGYYRPEAIRHVLALGGSRPALGAAVEEEQERKRNLRIDSGLPPGARLHLLAIGVSRYNAEHLELKYAQQDARDVYSALIGTQEALWVAGNQQYLADEYASRKAIRRGLETLRIAMTGTGDLAVIYFSGHGAMVRGQLYLLPHDVKAGDALDLQDSAVPMAAIRTELMLMAEHGRVLVLLDACYSGGASLDGSAQEVSSAMLTTALAATNISVLTSSSASQASREDPRWQNGAFTEAFLEALSAADADHDSLIGATELAAYLDRRVRALTDGAQCPTMELRFNGTLFAVC